MVAKESLVEAKESQKVHFEVAVCNIQHIMVIVVIEELNAASHSLSSSSHCSTEDQKLEVGSALKMEQSLGQFRLR